MTIKPFDQLHLPLKLILTVVHTIVNIAKVLMCFQQDMRRLAHILDSPAEITGRLLTASTL